MLRGLIKLYAFLWLKDKVFMQFQVFVQFLQHGLLNLPWWGLVLVTLGLTHITIASVTIFLHRHQAHRGLDLHAIPSHFFRFWLWLTTGMVTREWVGIHRKHHAFCETKDDPHSPQVLGLKKVLLQGAELYRAGAKDKASIEKYSRGTPNDWIERNLYTRHSALGIALMLIVDVLLFGVLGITVWAVQMLWIPVTAAGVINGIGHAWGYRNFECEDASTNVLPWGILIGGEELHNNHHTFGTSAKLSYKWWEFDIGWMYIRILALLGLAKVHRVAPQARLAQAKPMLDLESLQAIITHRYDVVTAYAQSLKTTCAEELSKLQQHSQWPQVNWRKLNRHINTDSRFMSAKDQERLQWALAQSQALQTIHNMRQELTALWERSNLSSEQLVKQLQDWCQRAENSGIEALQHFAYRLRCYA